MKGRPSTSTAPAEAPGPTDRTDGPTRRSGDHDDRRPALIVVLAADPVARQSLAAAVAAADGPVLVQAHPLPEAGLSPPWPDAAEDPPDLILLDGSQAAAGRLTVLRDDPYTANTPIIVVVPPPPQAADAIRQALAGGATDVVASPIDPAELTLRLRTVQAARQDRDRLLRHDVLTGLPNRAEFLRRAEQLLATSPTPVAEPPGPLRRTLLLLNLDRFKPVNASLGHAAGDALLVAVAARLTEIIARHLNVGRRDGDQRGPRDARDRDTARRTHSMLRADPLTRAQPWLARTESDGFMAMLPGGRGDAPLEACLTEIVASFDQSHAIAGRDLVTHASLGLATFPADGTDISQLLRRASLALAYAKRRGGRRLAWFDGIVERRAADRLLTEEQLRQAIGQGQLRLWYQPKVDCATLSMVGAEALVRWQHPDRGLIGPQWFVPVAETSGLIVELGEWVLAEACRQGEVWRAAGYPPIDIAVNVSAGQTRRGDLVATVRNVLSRSGYPPERLTLELTESLLMADDEATNRMIGDLRALGTALSLDDFGTGFASMTMLRRFAFDEIKIDRSFIRGLPTRRDGAAITRAIATLAGDLGLDVVAEGVESTAELTFLRQFPGCRFQGELFSKPVDVDSFTSMLAATAHRRSPTAG